MFMFRTSCRALAALTCAAALTLPAPRADAAPITSDGTSMSGVRSDGLADVMNLIMGSNQLADRFARTADFSGLIVTTDVLRNGLPDNAEIARLLAAAHAAGGNTATSRDLLDAATAIGRDTTGPWAAVAESILARRAGDLDRAAAQAAVAIEAAPDNAYAHNAAGAAAAAAEDLEIAASHFSAAVERGPDSAVYVANLGATLAALGDDGLARAALRRALELDPDSCVALIAAADLAVSQAAPLLERCLAAEPGHTVAATRLIDVLIAREDLAAARAAVASHGDALETPAATQALIALHGGDADGAREHIAAMPSDARRALFSAYAAALAGDSAAGAAHALDAFRSGSDPATAGAAHLAMSAAAGIAPDPQISAAIEGRADSRFFVSLGVDGSGDLDGTDHATSGFSRAGLADQGVTADPAARRAVVLGVMWRNAGFAGPARHSFAAAVDAEPGSALAHFLHALTLGEAATPDRYGALESLDAAITASPTFAAAHRTKAELLARGGAFAEARDHLNAAMQIEDRPIDRLSAGAMAEAVGDHAAARADYERAVDLAPDFFAALNQLAWFMAERDIELDRALSLAERANEVRPDNASVLDTRGLIRFKLGDMDGALADLRRAHEIDGGGRPEITLRLAEMESAAGNDDRAETLLQSVVAMGGPTADTARAHLNEQGG